MFDEAGTGLGLLVSAQDICIFLAFCSWNLFFSAASVPFDTPRGVFKWTLGLAQYPGVSEGAGLGFKFLAGLISTRACNGHPASLGQAGRFPKAADRGGKKDKGAERPIRGLPLFSFFLGGGWLPGVPRVGVRILDRWSAWAAVQPLPIRWWPTLRLR